MPQRGLAAWVGAQRAVLDAQREDPKLPVPMMLCEYGEAWPYSALDVALRLRGPAEWQPCR